MAVHRARSRPHRHRPAAPLAAPTPVMPAGPSSRRNPSAAERSGKYHVLKWNPKVAKALGLKIPHSILVRAERAVPWALQSNGGPSSQTPGRRGFVPLGGKALGEVVH